MMRIVIVGGSRMDEEHLSRVAAAAAVSLQLTPLPRHESREHGGSREPTWPEELEQEQSAVPPRALVFEALERPDLAAVILRAVRGDARFHHVATLIAVSPGHVARIDTAT